MRSSYVRKIVTQYVSINPNAERLVNVNPEVLPLSLLLRAHPLQKFLYTAMSETYKRPDWLKGSVAVVPQPRTTAPVFAPPELVEYRRVRSSPPPPLLISSPF